VRIENGSLDTLVDDLWTFNLSTNTWHRIQYTGGPKARFDHITFTVGEYHLVVFGRMGSSTYVKLAFFLLC
jgi:N-acetylneuraminic acid mutarotase